MINSQKARAFLVTLLLALPACAASRPATLSGEVRNAKGVPQMGAAVEVFTSAATQALLTFTDANGHYSVHDLKPGTYFVRVSAASFLPSLRENVSLRAGSHFIVNLTLNTLFEAISVLPPRRAAGTPDDDWKWTLRSAANRPILRVLEDGAVLVSNSDRNENRELKAKIAFVAGSDAQGFGRSSDLTTDFEVERPLSSSGVFSVNGSLGYGAGAPSGAMRASYSRQKPDGSASEAGVTVRRFAPPTFFPRNALLGAMSLYMAETFALGESIEINYGGEFQAVQFMGRTSAFHPYGSVDFHPTPNTLVEYRYASAQSGPASGSGAAGLNDSGPRLSLLDYKPRIESARHHELSFSERIGKSNIQVAVYSDRLKNMALAGVGDATPFTGDFLPDVYSETFTYRGGNLNSNGLRLVVQRKIHENLTGTFNYSVGNALVPDVVGGPFDSTEAGLHAARRHSFGARLAGRVPGSKTQWSASYRWCNGRALSEVDGFNSSPGHMDPYLNIVIRQPIGGSFFPGKVEAVINIRNLLAQGYIPVVTADGSTLYLVQTARSVRGGLAFTF